MTQDCQSPELHTAGTPHNCIREPEPEPRIYRIIRFFRSGGRRTIHSGVTLSVAQLHCSDPRTSKGGLRGYFDGYDYIRGYKKPEGE